MTPGRSPHRRPRQHWQPRPLRCEAATRRRCSYSNCRVSSSTIKKQKPRARKSATSSRAMRGVSGPSLASTICTSSVRLRKPRPRTIAPSVSARADQPASNRDSLASGTTINRSAEAQAGSLPDTILGSAQPRRSAPDATNHSKRPAAPGRPAPRHGWESPPSYGRGVVRSARRTSSAGCLAERRFSCGPQAAAGGPDTAY